VNEPIHAALARRCSALAGIAQIGVIAAVWPIALLTSSAPMPAASAIFT